MIYFNNELLGASRILEYIHLHLDTLSRPQQPGTQTISKFKQFQKRLSSIFFEKGISEKDMLASLQTDERFESYPKLKAVLHILLSLEKEEDLPEAISHINAISESDWICSPEKFDEYNRQYGYFSFSSVNHKKLFEDLVGFCRLHSVLFEKNNIQKDMAYDYAYKLMVLLVDPESSLNHDKMLQAFYASMNQLLKGVDTSVKAKPLHDILLVKFPYFPAASKLADVPGWRELVKNFGVDALPFWCDAEKIERSIGNRAPKNLDEAKQASYDRWGEDPKFAELCKKYKVPEERFNRCLDFLASGWPQKHDDWIPDLAIQGQGVASKLFWVKLPVTDKRALILGDIVDCCQSIGGHSEKCVKDAVSLKNNGIYVLLKAKRSMASQMVVNGEINEHDFKIVGQAYVWRSLLNNVCLDSIECLNNEVTIEQLQSILSDFSASLLRKHSEIYCVTLGCGGKTPEDIFSKTAIAEYMLEGTFYGDADKQYCILGRDAHLDKDMFEQLKSIFKNASDDAIDYLSYYLSPQSNGFWGEITDLFVTSEEASKNQALLEQVSDVNALIYVLIFMHTRGFLLPSIRQMVFNKLLCCPKNMDFKDFVRSWISNLASAFNILEDVGLFSGNHTSNRKLLLEHHAPKLLACGLKILHDAGFLSEDNDEKYKQALSRAARPDLAAAALQDALSLGWLTKNSLSYGLSMISHRSPESVILVLKQLDCLGVLQKKHRDNCFDDLLCHNKLNELYCAIQELDGLECFKKSGTQEIFEFLLHHAEPWFASAILQYLDCTELLSGENAKMNLNAAAAIVRPEDCMFFLEILEKLLSAELLSGDRAQANFDALIKHKNYKWVSEKIKTLEMKKELSQASFETLLSPIQVYKEALEKEKHERSFASPPRMS